MEYHPDALPKLVVVQQARLDRSLDHHISVRDKLNGPLAVRSNKSFFNGSKNVIIR